MMGKIAKSIVVYLLALLVLLAWLWTIEIRGLLPDWLAPYSLPFNCALVGCLGGITYCLRSVYLNRSVRGHWNNDWNIWYFVRPVVSAITGIAAYIFLKAGLLVLDASSETDIGSVPYGFLALSYIAGLNVDRFIVRLEEIAKSTWNINPSRTSDSSKNREEN
ncbi:hypothetical protein HML84_16020 [Alcanivorax sp. IO_7]|jgi:hypothetical protein|nr:hypothetical protein HML84_16020 [Alcanivorax sp. IO_7]